MPEVTEVITLGLRHTFGCSATPSPFWTGNPRGVSFSATAPGFVAPGS